jgi:[ribosomal protein S5]-alanine N-acetyltransferase
VQLRTRRLELRPLELADARALVDDGRPPGRRRAAGYPTESTLVAAGLLVAAAAERRELTPFTTYHVIRRADGAVIGDCGFHGPPEGGCLDLGFAIAGSAQGRGYATEAVEALIGLGLLQPGVRCLRAETTRSNPASCRVLEKAGMRRVRESGELLVYEA